jgi:hypothetical protein
MATLSITSAAQPVTLPAGSPVTVSAACTLGLTAAGAASGPSVNGSFSWPVLGGAIAEGELTLYVQTATTATLTYLS